MAAYDCITDLPPPSRTWDGAEEGEVGRRKQPQIVATWIAGATPQPGKFMVVALSRAALMLLENLSESSPLGALAPPATTVSSSQGSGPSAANSLSLRSWGSSENSIVLAMCHGHVAPSDAVSWAHAIFDNVKPERVLILDMLLSRDFRSGQGRYTLDDDPVFQLATDAEKVSGRDCSGLPFLPSGSLVEGLPSALLSHCQVRNLPGQLLVGVQQGPKPNRAALNALASALKLALEEPLLSNLKVQLDTALQKAKEGLGRNANQPLVSDMFV